MKDVCRRKRGTPRHVCSIIVTNSTSRITNTVHKNCLRKGCILTLTMAGNCIVLSCRSSPTNSPDQASFLPPTLRVSPVSSSCFFVVETSTLLSKPVFYVLLSSSLPCTLIFSPLIFFRSSPHSSSLLVSHFSSPLIPWISATPLISSSHPPSFLPLLSLSLLFSPSSPRREKETLGEEWPRGKRVMKGTDGTKIFFVTGKFIDFRFSGKLIDFQTLGLSTFKHHYQLAKSF